MTVTEKKQRSYGYLIDWIIRGGDLLFINAFFILAYILFKGQLIESGVLSYEKKLEALLLINLSYFITITFIKINISLNVLHIDKIVQNSIYFIIFYTLVLTAVYSVFRISQVFFFHWLIFFAILGIILTVWHVAFRLLLKVYRRRGYNYKTVIIIGGGINGINIYKDLINSDFGYKMTGFFDDNINNRDALPNYLGDTSKIKEYLSFHKIDEIYCTLPASEEAKILELISLSEKNMIRLYLVPEFHKYIRRRFTLNFQNTIPVLTLRYEPLEHVSNRFTKRCFDILFASLFVLTVYPVVYLIFGILIKLSSPGPIYFKQERTGLKGQKFHCYKFRSMKLNKEAHQKSARENDPRVTKIGAFMRKTSIDELPQFINVLKGEMSIVGPRPHMLQHTEQYSKLIEKFMVRHLVKPGITGWAQVTGHRGETKVLSDMENRVQKDVWYLENWSFLLDLKIISKTVFNVFKGEDNAY